MSPLLIVSTIWLLSEIGLSFFRRSTSSSVDLDKSSLKILWIIISFAITAGVYFGSARIGYLNFYPGIFYFCGILLISIGLLIRWIAIFQLRKFFTVNVSIKIDHQLFQKGLYKFVRHPAYSGSLLSVLGLAISFNNWASLLIIFFPILYAFLHRISIEEKELLGYFGNTYEQYRRKTKRIIPGIY